MVDWPGLFQWSMAQQENYSGEDKSKFKEMDPETRQWLTEAFEEYFQNDADMIAKGVKTLKTLKTEQSHENQLILMENLLDLMDSLDRNVDFCKAGGMPPLFEILLNQENIYSSQI